MDDRKTAWESILAAFERITKDIKATISGVQVQNTTHQQKNSLRLIVSLADVKVKIELSPVIRGTVFAPQRMEVHELVEKEFGYAEIMVASHADLYAGKLCAALDRQHPRDLFDVLLLYQNEGLTDDLRKTFLLFLVSHFRPMSELLNPNRKDIAEIYESEFVQMADVDISLEELLDVRERLINDINSSMTVNERNFLLSVKNMTPDFSLLDLEYPDLIANLPSVKWKLINLARMPIDKHEKAYEALRVVLYPGT